MINFSHYLPTRFVFGRGVEDQTGEQVRALGATKVLIHYGGGSAVRSGLIARVEASLDAAGVKHVSLGGAQPNPRDTKVYEGIDLIRREKVDFVLAVARPSTRPRPWRTARSTTATSGISSAARPSRKSPCPRAWC